MTDLKYVKGLDTLRAFAVALVIVTHWGPHYFHSAFLTTIFTKVIPDGRFGVDLFFVLSGYLITRILIAARDQHAGRKRSQIVVAFFIRRALRIFPIYFLLVFGLLFCGDLFVSSHWVYFLSYTTNILTFRLRSWESILHTWSLSVEEQFYLVWPWIIIFLPKKYLGTVMVVTFLSGIIAQVLLVRGYGDFGIVLMPACLSAFAVGALYALGEANPAFQSKIVFTFQLLLPMAMVSYIANRLGYSVFPARPINAIIAISLIAYVLRGKYNRLSKGLLENSILNYVGKISYGIYLYHYILPGICDKLADNLHNRYHFSADLLAILKYPPPAYLIHLIILLAISHFSYQYIELPVLRLKKKFAYTRTSYNYL